MVEVIENDFLSVELFSAGAEPKSIIRKADNKEFLWQGSALWWPRRAPILFPIVGKLTNNTYTVNSQKYTLPQHGFARDQEFAVAEKQAQSVTFNLESNEELLQVYPFLFGLKIIYQLEGQTLHVNYVVQNRGTDPMYFSIGAHPGFICPFYESETLSDYYLEFEKPETLDRHLLDEGLFNGTTENVLKDQKILDLNDDLFLKDAIVFKDLKSNFLSLKSRKTDYTLKFDFAGFPYLGIWTKPGAPFICIEPWCGIADNTGFKGELKDKEGIEMLKPGESFERKFSITI